MGYERVLITKFGGPEVLKMIEETKLPEPKSGEVRVKVLVRGARIAFVTVGLPGGMRWESIRWRVSDAACGAVRLRGGHSA